jgi:hypothetical protein
MIHQNPVWVRSITEGYKRTPTVALEREAYVPPLDLYTEATALQRARDVNRAGI